MGASSQILLGPPGPCRMRFSPRSHHDPSPNSPARKQCSLFLTYARTAHRLENHGDISRVAGKSVTSSPPTKIFLRLSSRPAIILRVVVFPQPDGPRSVTSVPASTVGSISPTATASSHRFLKRLQILHLRHSFLSLDSYRFQFAWRRPIFVRLRIVKGIANSITTIRVVE